MGHDTGASVGSGSFGAIGDHVARPDLAWRCARDEHDVARLDRRCHASRTNDIGPVGTCEFRDDGNGKRNDERHDEDRDARSADGSVGRDVHCR
jgi:hypothetical protein